MDDLEKKITEEPVNIPEEPKVSAPAGEIDQEEFVTRRQPNGSWVGAVILIFVGFIFLLREMGLPLLDNWWALFIIIPAVACFGSAWNNYHNHANQFSSGVMGSLIGGVILTIITAIFLFNLNWSYMWPTILIVIGLLIFINSFLKK
jgi:hypothetical protein